MNRRRLSETATNASNVGSVGDSRRYRLPRSTPYPQVFLANHRPIISTQRPAAGSTNKGPRAAQPDQRRRSVSSPAATVAGMKPGALFGCRARVPAGPSSDAAPCPDQRSGPAECVPAPLRPGRPAGPRQRSSPPGRDRPGPGSVAQPESAIARRPLRARRPSRQRFNLATPSPNLGISASQQPKAGLARTKKKAVYLPCPLAVFAP